MKYVDNEIVLWFIQSLCEQTRPKLKLLPR